MNLGFQLRNQVFGRLFFKWNDCRHTTKRRKNFHSVFKGIDGQLGPFPKPRTLASLFIHNQEIPKVAAVRSGHAPHGEHEHPVGKNKELVFPQL